MRDTLFGIFYNKLPDSIDDIMPSYSGSKIITCLNPYYMIMLKPDDYPIYKEFDYICSDGMGPLKLNRLFGHEKSIRLSFDMSSMAGPVFEDVIKNDKGLYLIGAKADEIERSVETIKSSFPRLRIVAFHHGYIKGQEEAVTDEIIASGAQVCVIGMGAPMQDEVAVMLKKKGFIGTVYTCGGFIHQTQNDIISFPEWTNKLGLRWLYRLFTQKGMLKRLLQSYPRFVITYSLFLRKMGKE